MRKAVYPGSFDPVTLGHLDIIQRSCRLFDTLVVAVACNISKKGLFTFDERVALIQKAVEKLPNVKVEIFDCLLVNYMKDNNIKVIVRGLRAISDFEYEFQMALLNKQMTPEIETIFLVTNTEYSYVSSSVVKEIASFGGSVKGLVPAHVDKALKKAFAVKK